MSNPNTPFVTYEPGVPLPEKVCKKCEGRGEDFSSAWEEPGRKEFPPCPDCHGSGKAPLRVLVEQPGDSEALDDLLMEASDHLNDEWFVLLSDLSMAAKCYTEADYCANIHLGIRIRRQADVAHIADLVRLPGKKFLLVEPEEVIDFVGEVPRVTAEMARDSDFLERAGEPLLDEPGRLLDGIGWVVVRCPSPDCVSQGHVYDPATYLAWMQNVVNQCQAAGMPVYCQELGVFEEGI